MSSTSVLVLALSDAHEAKRVAAGITIMGHAVRLIIMTPNLPDPVEAAVQYRNLKLAGITPETTVPELADRMVPVDGAGLAAAIAEATHVLSL